MFVVRQTNGAPHTIYDNTRHAGIEHCHDKLLQLWRHWQLLYSWHPCVSARGPLRDRQGARVPGGPVPCQHYGPCRIP